MSTTVESDSIYEAYDPTLVYLNAEQVKEVSNGPAVSSQNSAYLAPVSKQDTVVTHSQPQSPGNDYGMLSNVRTEFFRIDTRYLRSLEGIMRFVSLPLAVVGVILAWVYVINGGEIWYAAQGSAYFIYVVVVVLVETLLAEVFVHRLVDGVITAVFAVTWLSAAVAVTYGARLQGGALSKTAPLAAPATFAYIEALIVTISAVLAFRTWKIYGGKQGSPPLY